MPSEPHYSFDDFHLDVVNRQLWRGGVQIDLNGRYFDVLVLLVQEHGQLVEKDQFFSNVWGDVIVSDAALTQCIKDIRKQLGDDAGNPRYIQTVPRHGYRFIGSVEATPSIEFVQNGEQTSANSSSTAASEPSDKYLSLRRILIEGGTGTLGGAIAGLLGGILYGFSLAYAPGPETSGGMGTASMLLVLISLCVIIGGMGGLGVSFGMATANISTGGNKAWTVIGAAFGGLLIGGLAKLLGVDAFNLLFGRAPEGITGGLEGAVLGAAVALGAMFGGGLDTPRLRPVMMAAFAGAAAGILISIAGGCLMSGSLDLLTRSFTDSQLRLDALGHYFGEMHFGYITQTVLSGFEGFLFGACVVGSIVYMRRVFL
ncbi:MAG TPA: transcriptional regulator [Balneolaceae bacterium]